MEPITVLGLLFALLGPLVVARLGDRIERGQRRMLRLLAAQASLLFLVLFVYGIARRAEGLAWHELGLKAPSIKSILLGVVLAGFFVYAYGPAASWVLSRLRLEGFGRGLSTLEGLPLWYLLLAVLIGGTVEEMLYRGYAFERLLAVTGSIWLAAAIPLLLFALAHVPMWGWPAAGTMLVSGSILTAWYAWQRDLTANIVAHCLTDFVGIVVPAAIGRHSK
jgi:membrane protease YdiL (CAAX protease family)